jgi:putative oxidoreductase
MDLDKTLRDVALLTARLALGGTMIAHGAQKQYGAFGGPGHDKAAQMMHSLGLRPGERHATMASSAEMASGGLIALGLGGPIGPAILTSIMLVAIETVHKQKGFWNSGGGYEMNVMILMLALLLANNGYGSLSLDGAIGVSKKMHAGFAWLALAGGIAAAAGILSQREFDQPTSIGETIREKTGSPA